MADNVIEQVQPQIEAPIPQVDANAQFIKEQMAISLNLNNPVAAQIPVETNEEKVASQPAEVVAQVNEPVTVSDPFNFLKEKFQYQSHEDAIKEIEELRAFKAAPRLPEFQVPDDESAKILKALAAGKRDEVYKYLHHEMRIDQLVGADVTKDTAGDIVKLGMQLKYQDLTPEEINYKFNKQFAIPPQPVKGDLEDDVDYQQRLGEWQNVVTDKQMELMIEAKLAKPELQKSKSNFVFPEIEAPEDEGYIQYKAMLEERAKSDQVIKEAYKAIAPKDVQTKVNFKDEANKIDFEFQFEPDADGFSKAVGLVSDADLFWQSFMNPDGSPNRQKLLDAVYYANNKEKVLLSAMNQAKNAAIKAQLPDNSEGGMLRQTPQYQEPDELKQHMEMALGRYVGR